MAGIAALLMTAAGANAMTMVTGSEPNDTFATGQTIAYRGGTIDITGYKEEGGIGDWFLFRGTADNRISIDLSGGTLYDPLYGTFLDPNLTLVHSDGLSVAFDDDGAEATAAKIAYELASTGTYDIDVGSYEHDDTFSYGRGTHGPTASEEPKDNPEPDHENTLHVPYPGTLLLFGLGLAGLGFVRRRKAA